MPWSNNEETRSVYYKTFSTSIIFFHFIPCRFSQDAYNEFYLDSYVSNPQDLKSAILKIGYVGGYTNTADGIRYAMDQQFTQARGDRTDAPNVIIVVTDGASNINSDQTIPNAEEARRRGITVGLYLFSSYT